MRTFIFSVLLGSVLLGAAACGEDNTPVCVPKTKLACFCETGERGEQTCRDDGHDYHQCACLPDAGVDAPPDDAPTSTAAAPAR